ncbi:MAG: hypothetical protein HQL95_03490 [Magnetococcales bacterium]|nr:hypothetical protein [Magnetococcales bacterium]
MKPRIVHLLGAEQQAAVSLAMAWPDLQMHLFSDQSVVDGWDLPHVSIHYRLPDQPCPSGLPFPDLEIPLCPRWLADAGKSYALSCVLPRIATLIPACSLLPVSVKPPVTGRAVVKGDLRHRPDAPLAGEGAELGMITDPNGCGLVFQEQIPDCVSPIVVTGRRSGPGSIALGVLRVREERFFRITVLQAAETIREPCLVEQSLAILDALDHTGFFTLHWLVRDSGQQLLSSFRPTPLAAFQALRKAGIDLVTPASGITIARAGICLIAEPTYTTYQKNLP